MCKGNPRGNSWQVMTHAVVCVCYRLTDICVSALQTPGNLSVTIPANKILTRIDFATASRFCIRLSNDG